MDPRGTEKKERLLNALNLGMVMVHLDARRPGVVVPVALRTEAHLRLNMSYRFDPPDLSVNEWGVRQTLSFGGSRFTVAIPWSALFAVTSHVTKEFWMFPEDLPPELLQATAPGAAPSAAPATKPSGRPQLRPVAALAMSDASEEEPGIGPGSQQEPTEPSAPRPAPKPMPSLAAARPLEPEPPAASEEKAPSPSEPGPGPSDEPPKPRGRPHLRVVK